MPPTPPSSHGSDSEGSQSPVHAPPGLSCPTSPTSPAPAQASLKVSPRAASSLSNSPLLTAPHVGLLFLHFITQSSSDFKMCKCSEGVVIKCDFIQYVNRFVDIRGGVEVF